MQDGKSNPVMFRYIRSILKYENGYKFYRFLSSDYSSEDE